MKRYFDKNDNSYNNYCDEVDGSYMVEIPDDGKPYGFIGDEIADISNTHEYQAKIKARENAVKKAAFQAQIDELDKKRVRAGFEPSVKDETTGQTWLEYYNLQVQELRNQLAELG